MCFSIPASAATDNNTPPDDGTSTPFGVYGVVDNIGLAPASMSRMSVYNTTVNLAPGSSFTSYQYQISSNYSLVTAGLLPRTSGTKFKVLLYGSNTVGGTKTLVGSKEMSYVGTDLTLMQGVTKSRTYTYYNIVVTNTGTKTGSCYVELNKD